MATVKAIKYGMKGDDVTNLQTTLKNLGYNLDVDGSFGPQTLAAVKSYQQKNGLAVDGMVGPQTTAALYGTSTKASSRPATSSPISAPSQPISAPSQPAHDPDPTPSQPVTEPDVLVSVSRPSSPISAPSQPATDPDPAPSTEPDMTPSIAPTSTPGAGSAGPTGTQIMYPDNFSYDDFTYEDYQSSGKVDKAVGDGFSYDKFSYADYAESETVQQANAALQAILAAQPGAYQSKWQSQIDDIINRILNREEFSYDVNEDALYQQYKDQYIQGGKLAMQDTMGQAAAMTGGYGNSYAASVGNQAYQNYLSKLNEVVPELYGMALDRYNMEGEEMYNQYGLLSSQEQQDYARYQDSYNQWLAERDYATGRYDSEREYDYSKYVDDRNYEYGVYSDDRAQKYSEYLNAIDLAKWQETDAYNKYLNDKNFAYGAYADSKQYAYNDYLTDIEKAQYNAQFLEDQRQYNANMAFNKEQAAISNSQWEQSFAEQQKQNAIGNDQWQQSFNESKRQYEEAKASAASGGSGSSGSENAALDHVASMSSAEIVETMQGYSADGDNTGLAAFLDDCVASGRLTEAQADAYYEKYRKGNGHTITDTTVPTPSRGSSTATTGKGLVGNGANYIY